MNIEINALHTLENFRDAYDDETSVVVLEAMANALDANADRVEITLKNYSITFKDNGPGMDRKQFKAYHKISGVNKKKELVLALPALEQKSILLYGKIQL